MSTIFQRTSLAFLGLMTLLLGFSPGTLAQQRTDAPPPVSGNSMVAATPFSDFTLGAIIYTFLVAFLVTSLLIFGFMVVNIGLMSKREQDHIGGRTPSDLGVLKGSVWPPEPDHSPVLPAEEEEEGQVASLGERRHRRFGRGRVA